MSTRPQFVLSKLTKLPKMVGLQFFDTTPGRTAKKVFFLDCIFRWSYCVFPEPSGALVVASQPRSAEPLGLSYGPMVSSLLPKGSVLVGVVGQSVHTIRGINFWSTHGRKFFDRSPFFGVEMGDRKGTVCVLCGPIKSYIFIILIF